MTKHTTRVKFLSTIKTATWLHQFPQNNPLFNDCLFIFDRDETEYDWLIVYDDLPPSSGERFSLTKESLQCPQENTVLITQEPSSIKYYGSSYTAQFGHVITSQPNFCLPHKNRIYSQPSLFWFYGVGEDDVLPYDKLILNERHNKTKNLSVVWSNKKQLHTAHHQRYRFLHLLRQHVPGLDVYGREEIPLDDKAEALDEYKYHVAIENHYGKHHWTEKFADPILGLSLPFYYGCPNIADYFPQNSYITIDIFQPEKSLEIIQQAISNNEYEKRIDSIKLAKQKIVEEYNLFVVLTRLIERSSNVTHSRENKTMEVSARRYANRKNVFNFFYYVIKKSMIRSYYIINSYFFRPKTL